MGELGVKNHKIVFLCMLLERVSLGGDRSLAVAEGVLRKPRINWGLRVKRARARTWPYNSYRTMGTYSMVGASFLNVGVSGFFRVVEKEGASHRFVARDGENAFVLFRATNSATAR